MLSGRPRRRGRYALPNLQLLEGTTNVEKQARLPLEWASERYGDGLPEYLSRQELAGLPAELTEFPAFYDGRRERLARRLAVALGVDSASLPLVEDE